MAKKKVEEKEYYGPAIRKLLIAIDDGQNRKRWLRKELIKKEFVYKAYTKTEDKSRRKRFARELIEEQDLIIQFRKAIKLLRKSSTP